MNTDTAFDFVVALLVVMVVALQIQILKLNKRLGGMGGAAEKK